MILGKQRGTEAARRVQIGEAGGRETPELWFWLIIISNGGIFDDHGNNDDSTPLQNVLFLQFEFLTTEQSETYLCPSLFGKVKEHGKNNLKNNFFPWENVFFLIFDYRAIVLYTQHIVHCCELLTLV